MGVLLGATMLLGSLYVFGGRFEVVNETIRNLGVWQWIWAPTGTPTLFVPVAEEIFEQKRSINPQKASLLGDISYFAWLKSYGEGLRVGIKRFASSNESTGHERTIRLVLGSRRKFGCDSPFDILSCHFCRCAPDVFEVQLQSGSWPWIFGDLAWKPRVYFFVQNDQDGRQDRQFYGHGGSSIQTSGVSANSGSFIGSQQHYSLEDRDACQYATEDRQYESVETDCINGHPKRLGFAVIVAAFAVGLFGAFCSLLLAWRWQLT